MITTISYQVYDNGSGGQVGQTYEMKETFTDKTELEARRKQLMKQHRIDADNKHITIYFHYREPIRVDKKI